MSPFQHECTACERTQLIFPTMATGLVTTARGTEMAFVCWCGAEQTHLLGAAGDHAAVPAAA
jgi:hypothetical protein